jgi:hypothetical protein
LGRGCGDACFLKIPHVAVKGGVNIPFPSRYPTGRVLTSILFILCSCPDKRGTAVGGKKKAAVTPKNQLLFIFHKLSLWIGKGRSTFADPLYKNSYGIYRNSS